MPNLEELQRSIRSAEDLYNVVRTMKVISAVSIHQYENAVASLADYYRTVEMGLQIVLREEPPFPEYGPKGKEQPQMGLIILGSGQGMCGRFNEMLLEFTEERLSKMGHRLTHTLSAGEHISDLLQLHQYPVTHRVSIPSSVEGINNAVSEILVSLEKWQSEQVHRVVIAHNRPEGNTSYVSRMHTLYPVDIQHFHRLETKSWPTNMLPQFTLPTNDLLGILLRQFFFVSLYRAFAESLAAEHGSRLASMQAAERKIEERLEDLTGRFRQKRQTAITEEVLDIISSWESSGGVQ
jgi:F-type H+-transporting ATPase subunit gamma